MMEPFPGEGPFVRDDRPPHDAAWRFYLLLALFDRRDGTAISDLVQAAREGYERQDYEDDAWQQFDAHWNRLTSDERLKLVRL